MIQFRVDANLPPMLATLLSDRGLKAEHLRDLGLLDAGDGEIWNYATRRNLAIITKDKDFAHRRIASKSGPPIVWIRLPNTRRDDLIRWLTRMLPNILSALESGELLIEVV